MELEFKVESYQDVINDVMSLLIDNYAETGSSIDDEPRPNYEKYQALEELGLMKLFTARNSDGALLGYSVFIISDSLHYMDTKYAIQDILFLAKSARKGMNAVKFIKWCDNELDKFGADIIYRTTKHYKNIGRLLERLEYNLDELVYCRRL